MQYNVWDTSFTSINSFRNIIRYEARNVLENNINATITPEMTAFIKRLDSSNGAQSFLDNEI